MKKIMLFLVLALVQLFSFAQAPIISYPSGTHTYNTGTVISPLSPTNTGGAVPATIYGQVSTFLFTSASFYLPKGVAVDSEGNVYVADSQNYKIRKITAAGVVTTLAGSGNYGSADGTGTSASFSRLSGVTVDAGGNVYVADGDNNKIRKITATGVVTTLAGSGSIGATDGTGTSASFYMPSGVAVDVAGNVYVADSYIRKIRKITAAGVVSTLAGSGTIGTTDGTGTSASFYLPSGVAVDSAGNVYVADMLNHNIRKITATGIVTTLAGSGTIGATDGVGTAATFNSPYGIAVDSGGNVYVADKNNSKIRKITAAGMVTTLAGSGTIGAGNGECTVAMFNTPYGVTVDSEGNVYVADTSNYTIRKITAGGLVTTLAGSSGTFGAGDSTTGIAPSFDSPQGVAVDSGGNLYVADTNHNTIRKSSPTGVISILGVGSFNAPRGVAVDSGGNVYVADTNNNTIRKITATGIVSTLAGSGTIGATDGTGTSASFYLPSGVAVDSGGNVYVADTQNNKIRKITVTGVVTTLAGSGISWATDGTALVASFRSPTGVAVDSGGNVYVADAGNNTIRKITAEGIVTTLAGNNGPSGSIVISGYIDGTGSAAAFNRPCGVAVDLEGNVYVADAGINSIIRKITATGVVTTLAGQAYSAGPTDGVGKAAHFDNPLGVTVDKGGTAYVADTDNNKIRKINTWGYSISPSLPAGLSFDGATGVISGTPTTTMSATNYTVTAYNTSGSSSTTVVIATSTLGTTTFNKQELKLYPNPANSLLQIQTPNNISLDKVTVIDLTGKKVLEQTQNTSQVNVEHLANGMYIIEAFSGEEKLVSKFVKEYSN